MRKCAVERGTRLNPRVSQRGEGNLRLEDSHESSAGRPLAKFSAPRSPVWVARERLFRQLDAMLCHPLIWVSAPAGAGKTILAASYVQERKLRSLWYNLDQGDADPASFFYCLKSATRQLAPDVPLELPSFTPECQPNLELFSANFFREAYRAFPKGGILVLDNAQEVAQSEEFALLLKTAAGEIPGGVTLLCLSRGEPPASLSRLTVNRAMAALAWEDLQWTIEETSALASTMSRSDLTPEALMALNERVQGWAAGLVLLLRDTGEHHRSPLHPGGTEQTLFNYFAAEILATLPRRRQLFLLKTAFLPTVTAPLAAALSGDDEAAMLLDSLVEKNYFTVRLSAEPPAYRYHPLFHEFLLHHAKATLPREVIEHVRRETARLLIEVGDAEAAVPLLIEAADWPTLAGILCDIVPALVAHGRHLRLLRWLAAVPDAVIDGSPWLLHWKAHALMPVDATESHHLFTRAFDTFLAQGDALGLVLAWSGAVETIVHQLSRTERVDGWFEKLEVLRRHTDLDRSPDLQAYVAPQVVAIFALRGKMGEEIESWLSTAEALLSQPIDPTQRIMASFALLTFFHWSGQSARSVHILKQQEVILASGDVTPLAVIVTKICAAWFSWIYGRSDRCIEAIEEGLDISERTGVQHWTFLLLIQGTTNALLRNDQREAERFLARLEALYADARDMDRTYFHNERGRLELLKGRPEEALREQLMAVEIARSVGIPMVIAESCFGLSQAYHAVGEWDLARQHLAEARRQGERYGGQMLAFQCGLVESYYHWSANDKGSAARTLSETFSQARRQGYTAFGWWRQDLVARLCQFALEHEIEPAFTRNLIRQFQVPPPSDAMRSQAWPWAVRIQTLGGFSLIIDDRAAEFSGKSQHRPLELLKALIALGGCAVAVEQLADALWPDAEGDAAISSLQTTLHRLRKLLTHESAIVVAQGGVSLNEQLVWVDARVVKQMFEQLESTPDADLVEFAEKSLALCQGAFLESDPEWPWCSVPRERLQRICLSGLNFMGKRLEGIGEHALAIKAYERAVRLSPLSEQSHRALMACHAAQGNRGEALAVYARLRSALATNLRVEPSPVTVALATAIAGNPAKDDGATHPVL